MKKGALVGPSAALALAAAAFAQPAVIEDLGSLPAGVTSRSGAIAAAAQVDWYQFSLAAPVQLSDLSFLNIDTVGASFDTELAVYDSVGNLMATDDDDAVGLQSALSFGSGDATFPGTGGAVTNGRDGNLAAGTYYLAVVGYNTAFGTTGWTITTSGAATGSYSVNLSLGTASAIGDPSGTIDLGTLVQPQTINRSDPLASATVQVYKMVVPAVSNAIPNYLDIDTEGTVLAPTNATRLSIYNATGAYMGLTDATDGTGSLSQLSFGQTSPTRPAPGNGVAYNGRDGAIRPGTYYIAAAGPGTAPSVTSATTSLLGSYTSASGNSGTLNLNLRLDAASSSPSGVGSAVPATIAIGGSSLLRVTVAPGAVPPSTGLAVTVDLSQIGGSSTQTFYDDGSNGDVTPGDNIFSYQFVGNGSEFPAAYQLPFTVTDLESRSGFGNVPLTISAPTSPTGVGSSVPNPVLAGSSTLVRVTVTPGNYPPSTGLGATADLSGIGGSSTQQLFDDGSNGDVTPGDNIFSFSTTVPGATPEGVYAIGFSITDAESRSGSGTYNLTVQAPPGWDEAVNGGGDAGDLPSTAQVLPNSGGSLSSIGGTFDANDADLYLIEICDQANFSATTFNSYTSVDTQLWLFNLDGTGIAANDDVPTGFPGDATLQSRVSGTFVPANGQYLLGISRYNRDPVDAAAALIWANTPFDTERFPDGPGAINAVASWSGATTGAASYRIVLTGACFPSSANPCDVADTNCDGSLNGFDVEATEQAVNGDFSNFCQPSADLNQDGAENGFDVEYSEYLTLNC